MLWGSFWGVFCRLPGCAGPAETPGWETGGWGAAPEGFGPIRPERFMAWFSMYFLAKASAFIFTSMLYSISFDTEAAAGCVLR